jgi:putative NIF3 family GTP cyclohydrolase 1 type 2
MYLKELSLFIKKEQAPEQFQIDSEIYGFHYGDHNNEKSIKRVMLTVNLSLKSLHYAVKNKINFIISLNGLVNESIKNFKPNLINKLSILSKYPISIFVLGYPFYIAEGGVSNTIMDALYLKLDHPFEIKNYKGFHIPIGRICIPNLYTDSNERFTLEKLIHRVDSNLNIKPILYLGELKKEINSICIVSGEDLFIRYFDELLSEGCDCYITEKTNKSTISHAFDLGINLIEFSFFNCELLALSKLCNFLSLKFPYDEFYIYNSRNPLKKYTTL